MDNIINKLAIIINNKLYEDNIIDKYIFEEVNNKLIKEIK